MRPSIRPLRWLLVAFLACFLLAHAARAQGEVGPQSVWQPDEAGSSALFNCPRTDGCTLSGVMATHGATPEAVAFAQTHDDWHYLAAFTEQGRVDLGMLFAPMAANGNRAYQLLNGNPPVVDAQSARDADARAHPAYAPLYTRYPNLFLWGSDSVFDGMEPRPDGGQRFLFSYPLIDGCHACDLIDMARVAYDFDAAGNYLGLTYLDPASVAAAAPPAADPNRAKRQIAYTIATQEGARAGRGNIWLVDEDGGNPTQLSTSGLDCCATWSPDGTRLYYVRNTAAAADPGPSAIIERDMATGAERTIGPSTSMGSTLAVSSDGQTLAYVSNSPMPPNEAILIDNLACLNLLNLATNQSIQIDCLEQAFIRQVEFLPHEPSLLVELGGFEWTQIVTYPLFPSEPEPFPDVCCFSVQVASRDNRVYAVGNDYYMFTQFQANGWDGFGIFEYGQGLPEPVPLLISAERLSALELSPEEDRLVYSRDGQIEILDLSNRATTPVIAGMQPSWRPGGATTAPPIADLLARKEATFAQLETVTYHSVAGIVLLKPVDAFDETAARELVAELRAADPATIPPEQAAALERLVMQEETLAVLLEQYTRLASDEGDVAADMAVMKIGVILLLAKYKFDPAGALHDLALKAIEDFIKLWLNVDENEAQREARRQAFEATFFLINTLEQDAPWQAEGFIELAKSVEARAESAAKIFPAIVADGQPAIDQSVRSVRGQTPAWAVEGTAESAALQLEGLVAQSTMVSDLAHNIYVEDISKGRDFNELIKDFGDLLSVSSRLNFHALLVSTQARLQQILINRASSSVLSGAMTCTREAAARSGDYAFRPSQQVYQCRVPVPLNLGDFFNRLFTERTGRFGLLSPAAQSVSPEFDAALAAYRTALDGLRSAVASADPAAVALDAPAATVMARLDPTAGGADPAGQMALGVALTTVRLDAVLALLAADVWVADPAAADTDAFGELLNTAAANAWLPARVLAVAPLPPPPAAARPVVDAPATWTAVAGEPLAIPVTVMNIGGAALEDGRLSLELDGEVVAESPLPALAPGASAAVSPDFAPNAPGRFRLRIVVAGGDRPDYRTVDLLVEDAAQAATPESSTPAPPVNEAETDRPPADAPETDEDWLRPVLLGVMIVAGASFIIALAVYLRSKRHN